MKKSNLIIKILFVLLIVLIILLLVKHLYLNKKQTIDIKNEKIMEIKKATKNNISKLLSSEKNEYSIKDLEKENLILPSDDYCDSDKSKVKLTKNISEEYYTIEIELYCENAYNYVKEEVKDIDYCNETQKEQETEYEYKREMETEIFDHYECEDGYVLSNNNCIKKTTTEETKEADPIYENVVEIIPAEKTESIKKICDEGYALENDKCVKPANENNTNSLSCENGYLSADGKCTKPVETHKETMYYCENGMLKNDKCISEPQKKETTITYSKILKSEIEDKEYIKKYDAIDCSTDYCKLVPQYVYETSETSIENNCINGTLVDNLCINDAKTKEVKKYSCDYKWSSKNCNDIGFNQIGKICTIPANKIEQKEISCSTGTLQNDKCIVEPREKTIENYNCTTGALKGTSCEVITPKISSYNCPNDYVLKEKTCIKSKETILVQSPISIRKLIKTTEYKWSNNDTELGWIKTGNTR